MLGRGRVPLEEDGIEAARATVAGVMTDGFATNVLRLRRRLRLVDWAGRLTVEVASAVGAEVASVLLRLRLRDVRTVLSAGFGGALGSMCACATDDLVFFSVDSRFLLAFAFVRNDKDGAADSGSARTCLLRRLRVLCGSVLIISGMPYCTCMILRILRCWVVKNLVSGRREGSKFKL